MRALLLSLLIACGSTTSSPPGSPGAPDASAADAEAADLGADAGLADAASGPCDPFVNAGCPGAACIWIGGVIGAQCRMEASPPKAHEAACDRQLHDCRAGFACLQFQGERSATCRKLCRTGSHADCQNLAGASPDGYECSLVDRDRSVGACTAIVPECLPFDDMCEMGKYCEDSAGRLQCLPVGTARLGEPCPVNRCARGAICTSRAGGAATCHRPCDPSANRCPNAERCEVVMAGGRALPFGICVP